MVGRKRRRGMEWGDESADRDTIGPVQLPTTQTESGSIQSKDVPTGRYRREVRRRCGASRLGGGFFWRGARRRGSRRRYGTGMNFSHQGQRPRGDAGASGLVRTSSNCRDGSKSGLAPGTSAGIEASQARSCSWSARTREGSRAERSCRSPRSWRRLKSSSFGSGM